MPTRKRPRPRPETPEPPHIPPGTAKGGASFEAEIRWAYDAITRGDTELAKDRLRRILVAIPKPAHRVRKARKKT